MVFWVNHDPPGLSRSLCHAVFPLRWVEAPRATMAATTLRVTTLSGKQAEPTQICSETPCWVLGWVGRGVGVPTKSLACSLQGLVEHGFLEDRCHLVNVTCKGEDAEGCQRFQGSLKGRAG